MDDIFNCVSYFTLIRIVLLHLINQILFSYNLQNNFYRDVDIIFLANAVCVCNHISVCFYFLFQYFIFIR